MASNYVYLTGKAMWAKLDKPDELYNKYCIDLYLDKGSMKKFKDSGIQVEIKEKDGEEYVRLRRDPDKLFEGMPEKPKKLIWNAETEEYDLFPGLIGNGSIVNCKVSVYDTTKGKGHRLEAVAVEDLVEYNEGGSEEELPF